MENQNFREVVQIVERDENGVDTFILLYKDTLEMVNEFNNMDIWEYVNDLY
ncbi:MAG: hypothetical protein E7J99_09410 [Clostridium butyricum]|uniref:hypothetical protein n=1 Tax=Clostridium sp. TaxID=1506 RepID=UPI0029027EBC|nr:hypothetical protein [Clostridium sp.]MDU1116032.1 hypothetical protein [Clostridium sp.]MDU7712361.1 hypothetical protein [Clostridium butyricum]